MIISQLSTGDDFFHGGEVHSLLIPSSEESMKIKKYQILTCLIHVPRLHICHELRNE